MIKFTKRNLLLYFRDKSAVFFSLLSVLIIIALYALFLGDVWTGYVENAAAAELLMKSWIMSGLIAVTSVTTTLGTLENMVIDKSKKIYKDFYAAPISRISIAGGYMLSAFTVGVIMTLLAFVIAEIYLIISGAAIVTFAAALKMIGLILLSSFANTTIMFFIVSFFSSPNAYSIASTIVGTLIGFLTGIYLPIGTLPDAVQTIVKVVPTSHAASLLRETLMQPMMDTAFAGAPAQYVTEFKEMMGVEYSFGTATVTPAASALILLGTGILFFALAVLITSKKKEA